MAVIEICSTITYRSLMNKSKADLADMVLQYADANGKLHARLTELEEQWRRSRPLEGPGSADQ